MSCTKTIALLCIMLELHNETMCHAKNLRTIILFCIFWSYFPLIICNAISHLFCKLKTVKAIWMKLPTVVKHDMTKCHQQEPVLTSMIF